MAGRASEVACWVEVELVTAGRGGDRSRREGERARVRWVGCAREGVLEAGRALQPSRRVLAG